MIVFVVSRPRLRKGNEESSRRSVGKPGVGLGVEPQPGGRGRHEVCRRGSRSQPEARSTLVAGEEVGEALRIERDLEQRTTETGPARHESIADPEELARVRSDPQETRAVDDHAGDRALARQRNLFDGVAYSIVRAERLSRLVAEPDTAGC